MLVSAVVVVAMFLVASASASAAPLWSSVPSPFACSSSGNNCVKHTGFNPNVSNWGAYTNSRGNCTNYASYRLKKNGAAQVASPMGNASAWKSKVQQNLGASRVNGTPKVGSIAWWSGSHPVFGFGGAGHVGYVEKVSGGTVYISDSRWNSGSKRWTVTSSSSSWPNAFLHIKDAPPPPPPDRDGDGVPDSKDKCPTVKGPASNGGCPVTPLYSARHDVDWDGDGLDDIFFYKPGSGGDSIWYGTATKGTFEKGYSAPVSGTYLPIGRG